MKAITTKIESVVTPSGNADPLDLLCKVSILSWCYNKAGIFSLL